MHGYVSGVQGINHGNIMYTPELTRSISKICLNHIAMLKSLQLRWKTMWKSLGRGAWAKEADEVFPTNENTTEEIEIAHGLTAFFAMFASSTSLGPSSSTLDVFSNIRNDRSPLRENCWPQFSYLTRGIINYVIECCEEWTGLWFTEWNKHRIYHVSQFSKVSKLKKWVSKPRGKSQFPFQTWHLTLKENRDLDGGARHRR